MRYLIFISILFCQCSFDNKNPIKINEIVADRIIDDSIKPQQKTLPIKQACNCADEKVKFNHYTDLEFSNNGKKFHLDSLKKWKNNPKTLKIKSLTLIDFDTIPNEFSIFKNLNSIYLSKINSHQHLNGLNNFPKLKTIKLEGYFNLQVDAKDIWLQNIEVIHANKTKIKGIQSFKQLPNLKEIMFGFSGFEKFPEDFESLTCLSYFLTGAYMGEIDLRKIDLSKMKCLKEVKFHSWRKNLKGLPKGLESIEQIEIHHDNLTKEEKAILISLK